VKLPEDKAHTAVLMSHNWQQVKAVWVATDATVAYVLLRRSTNHISCVTVDALFYSFCLFPSFSHFQVVLVSIAMARITAMTSTRQSRLYDDSWGSYRLYRCLSRRLSRQNVATVVVVTDSHTQSCVSQQSSVVMNYHNRSSWQFVTTVIEAHHG